MLFQAVAVLRADLRPDQRPDRPADQEVDLPPDRAANHRVDTVPLSLWIAQVEYPFERNNLELLTLNVSFSDDSTNLSRIPRRTATSTTGTTPTSSRHNSMSGKKLGTPVNGSSSRPRTPTGLVSPASGVSGRFVLHEPSFTPRVPETERELG